MEFKSTAKSAFTLAEVLITLAIVGVIAALTIPSLISNVGNAEIIASWKSNYSTLSQAAALVTHDAGGKISAYTNAYDARNAFANRMNFILKCDGVVDQVGNCWHANIKKFDGTALTTIPATSPTLESSAVTSGGALVLFTRTATAADPISTNFTCLADGSTPCIDVFIDVNGFNEPNTLGKDIFKATVYSNKVAFSETTFGCGAAMGTGDTLGTGCGKYYLTRSS